MMSTGEDTSQGQEPPDNLPSPVKSTLCTAAMKMAPRRLKINNLQSDLMQTPFSCKVERQRRMKSYQKLAFLPRFPVTNGPVSQGLALPQVLLLRPALLANTLCRGQEMCTMSKLEVRIGDFG